MAATATDIESRLADLSDSAFDAFCEDISAMFDADVQCTRQQAGAGTVGDVRKHFKKLTAVHVVQATGTLDGTFQLFFDHGGLFILSGVIVMLPEKKILEDVRRGSVDDADNLTDAAREVGNLLVGSWDRIFRDECEGHEHFLKTNTFIGKPWEDSQKIGLAANEEVYFAIYEMTVASYPSFCCAAVFPMSVVKAAGSSAEPEVAPVADAAPPENAPQAAVTPAAEAAPTPAAPPQSTPEAPAAPVAETPTPAPAPAPTPAPAPPPAPAVVPAAPPSSAAETVVENAAPSAVPVVEEKAEANKEPVPPKADPKASAQPPSVSETPVAAASQSEDTDSGGLAGIPEDIQSVVETVVGHVPPAPAAPPKPRVSTPAPQRDTSLLDQVLADYTVSDTSALTDLLNQPARKIMTPEVIWCDPETTVQDVISLMQQHSVGYVLVGRDEVLEGLLSNSSIQSAVSPYLRPVFAKWRRPEDDATLGIKVKWIMSRPVRTVKPDTALASIIESMCRYGGRCLPVVDADSKVLGVITVFDILLRVLEADQSLSWKGKPPQAVPVLI